MIKIRCKPQFKCDIFGIGAMASSAISTAGQIATSIYATDKQYEATQETNDLNRQLAAEKNALDYQVFTEANEFNALEAQKSRDFSYMLQKDAQQYNSLSAQIDRAKAAGINPAAVAGGTGTTAVGQSSVPSPASSAPTPNFTAAQMQTPNLSALTGMSEAFANIGQSARDFAESQNIEEDTKSKMTFNKFYEEQIKAGLNLTKSEARKNYAAAQEMQESVNLMKQTRQKMQQEILLMQSQGKNIDADTFGKNIENAYKDKEIQARLKNLQSITGFNEIQTKFLAETFAARVYGVNLQNQKTAADVGLSQATMRYFEQMADLVNIQGGQAAFDFMLNQRFGADERQTALDFSKSELKGANWNNSTPAIFLHEMEGFVSSIGSAALGLGAIGGARAAGKRLQFDKKKYNDADFQRRLNSGWDTSF